MKTTAVEIKGSIVTVFALQVNSTDQELLAEQITAKITKGAAFMAKAPVLIDVNTLTVEQQDELDLVALLILLRDLDVVPVAIRGAETRLAKLATENNIGILASGKNQKDQDQEPEIEAEDVVDQKDEPEQKTSVSAINEGNGYKTKVITQPVRSGQRVFSPGDLIILSSVNAGAEVLARGNIHVYGALRGRAMAGIEGDDDVRIFCSQCNPELIAVAGDYMVNESLDSNVVNQSVMVTRNADGLIFSPLPNSGPK